MIITCSDCYNAGENTTIVAYFSGYEDESISNSYANLEELRGQGKVPYLTLGNCILCEAGRFNDRMQKAIYQRKVDWQQLNKNKKSPYIDAKWNSVDTRFVKDYKNTAYEEWKRGYGDNPAEDPDYITRKNQAEYCAEQLKMPYEAFKEKFTKPFT